MNLLRIAIVGLWAGLVSDVSEASIAVISNSTQAVASDEIGGPAASSFNGTTIPTSTALDTIDGTSYSKNIIVWSTSGSQTVFSFDMDHRRDGTRSSYASTFDNSLWFTTGANASYELSGYYQVSDAAANESGYVFQSAQLFDATSSTYVFSNLQESRNTHNEQFALGTTGGDSFNSILSALTGSLVAGHTYFFFFDSTIYAVPEGDSGASAVGNITLKIDEDIAVPEPLSFLVWACLGAVLGLVTQRRTCTRDWNQ